MPSQGGQRKWGTNMGKAPKYFVVETAALPEVFLKVAEAKRMLDTGEVDTVHRATQMVGISRSAFYKYKDSLRPFNDMLHGHIVTFQMMLKDEPGVLSTVLTVFANGGANILTINQGIPVSGCAAVTATVETNSLSQPLEALEHALRQTRGMVRCDILAG